MFDTNPLNLTAFDEQTLTLAAQVFEAARCGDSEALSQWLSQGLPVNLANHNGDTLLMLASYQSHYDTVKLLLLNQADVNRRNDQGQSPLAGAAFRGDLAMVKLLLQSGALINQVTPDGKTPLMFAAMFDQFEVVAYLLEQGADYHLRESQSMNAYDLAIAMDAQQTVLELDRWISRE